MTQKHISIFFLVTAGLNAALVLTIFFRYPPLQKMPGSWGYLINTEIIVLIYLLAALTLILTKWRIRGEFARVALYFGMTAAVIEMLHIALENFGHLGAKEAVVTGIFLLALLLVFLLAGYYFAKRSGKMSIAVWAGAATGALCMLVVSLYGLSQLFWAYPSVRAHDVGSPDFTRTGWTDFDAFVRADILEASGKILLLGPIIGGFLGLIGGLIARIPLARLPLLFSWCALWIYLVS